MFDFCMSWICIYNLCAQAFPVSEDIKVGAEARKYQVDSAIMATVIHRPAQLMLKDCSRTVALLQLTIGQVFLLKNLTRFSSWERMPSWLTLIWDGCE